MLAKQADAQTRANTYLELKHWYLHNSEEDQSKRVISFLENGLSPALSRAGAALIGAFGNLIGENGPYLVSLARYASMGAMQQTLDALQKDEQYIKATDELGGGPGLPFVRIETTLLRSFDVMPEPDVKRPEGNKTRIFELRTYESQSLATLRRKVHMFNEGEAKIFEHVGARPVFFGESIIGPRQPNLTYMLSYDDLAARDQVWKAFGSDPEWKQLSTRPELKDAQIVANISNVILRPLPFSQIK